MRRFLLLLALALLLAGTCLAQYTFLPVDYPGASMTALIGFNDHFEAVGYYRMPGGLRHPFLFSHGQFTPLDPDGLLGRVNSGALQINNRGDLVGFYVDAGIRHGFLLRQGVVTTVDYPGSDYSQVNGISDEGTIIGEFRDANGVYHGYIFKDGSFTQLDVPGALDTLPY